MGAKHVPMHMPQGAEEMKVPCKPISPRAVTEGAFQSGRFDSLLS